MKLAKIITVSSLIGFLAIVGAWLVFVGYFTSVYPPIEEYDFVGSENELLEHLSSLNPKYQTFITDTTGEYPNDYNVYFQILDSDSCAYHLKYSAKSDNQINIALIGVFDLIKNKGGYSNSDDEIINVLEKKFENQLLEKLKLIK